MATAAPADGGPAAALEHPDSGPDRTHRPASVCLGRGFIPEVGDADAEEADYGGDLFERTWGASDPATYSWLLGTLPAYVRCDPLLAELALDWLLWDEPWLGRQAAGGWLLRSRSFEGKKRVQRTGRAILRSRVGLWHLDEAVPSAGLRLRDRLGGDRVFLHTPSGAWPDPQDLLLARIYAFGRWRLVAGRAMLVSPGAVAGVVEALSVRGRQLNAPLPSDPCWTGWLKAHLMPVVVSRWLRCRLALPCPDRYHGIHR